jgi:hypothetical protein
LPPCPALRVNFYFVNEQTEMRKFLIEWQAKLNFVNKKGEALWPRLEIGIAEI